MKKSQIVGNPTEIINAQPRLHQRAREIQLYGTLQVRPFISSICFTTNIMASKSSWSTRLPNGFSCLAGSA